MTYSIASINARELMTKIKKGFNVSDFCAQYACTAEEFSDFINNTFQQEGKRKEISRKLRSNEKQKGAPPATPRAQAARKAKAKSKEAAMPEEPAKPEETAASEEPAKPEETVASESNAAPDERTELKKLREREEELSLEVAGIESSHKEAWTEHRAAADTIGVLEQKVEQLKHELEQITSDYESQLAIARAAEQSMNEASELWRTKRAELDEIRSSILALSTIKVYVYDTGEIEAEGEAELVFVNDSDAIYDRLLHDSSECLEDLRKKDLRVLSKLLALSKEQRYAFAFESPALEKAYSCFCE